MQDRKQRKGSNRFNRTRLPIHTGNRWNTTIQKAQIAQPPFFMRRIPRSLPLALQMKPTPHTQNAFKLTLPTGNACMQTIQFSLLTHAYTKNPSRTQPTVKGNACMLATYTCSKLFFIHSAIFLKTALSLTFITGILMFPSTLNSG